MPPFVANGFSILDGSTTPVSVTYAPESLTSGRTVLLDRRLSARDTQPVIVYSFDPAKPTRKTFKVAVSVAMPKVGLLANGTESVVAINRASAEFTMVENSTTQDRKHLRAALANALAHAYIKAGVEDLDPLY